MEILTNEIIYKTNYVYCIVLFMAILLIVLAACVAVIYAFDVCGIYDLFVWFLLAGIFVGMLAIIPPKIPSGKCRYKALIVDEKYFDQLDDYYITKDKEDGYVYTLEDK